eukprot:TRINITY_DN37193_c0_g1_i1.p1 TRINITY_DN37193_c0_g1~~TRINITY_DN37193_c0_g1_i1.p1  ORF type:complete len:696 (-),score=152.06 TRINITY_DN37193_c0_g1_i1:85-2172(-)
MAARRRPGRAFLLALLGSLACRLLVASAETSLCKALRLAMRRAANAGLLFYAHGTPTGAARSGSPQDLRLAAHGGIANATRLLAEVEDAEGGFEACIELEETSVAAAANLSRGLLRLLVRSATRMREVLSAPEPFGADVVDFFDDGISWGAMVRSGWPVFGLSALVEHELRWPTSQPLAINRLYARDPGENCSHEQEVFHEVSNLYFGEGRTVQLLHVREHLRAFLSGDEEAMSGPRFLLDVLFGEPLDPGRCPAALASAYATVADALQCHWQRPHSAHTHEMIAAAIERTQSLALKAFPDAAPDRVLTMLTSRWPLLQFLARLDPFAAASAALRGQDASEAAPLVLVSWSSREAELGGNNWAERFAGELFGGRADVELRADVECADIYVFRSKVPVNFGGVLVFVDGETNPEESRVGELLAAYPASIVIGPRPAGGLSLHIPVPYASTAFASRLVHTPENLGSVYAHRGDGADRRFAAYLAFKCWPHREHFFAVLNAAAKAQGLGGVDVLSRCGGSTQEESDRRDARYSPSFIDDAAELFSGYRFALVFENRIAPRYVTEKIVNAFLAGAIPIYWGSPFVFRMFEPSSFIYVNAFPSFEDAAQYIVKVAQSDDAYSSFFAKPPLRNTTDAHRLFSWHRQHRPVPADERHPRPTTLRDEIADAALQKVRAGLGGVMPAIERRPWDYIDLFARNEG